MAQQPSSGNVSPAVPCRDRDRDTVATASDVPLDLIVPTAADQAQVTNAVSSAEGSVTEAKLDSTYSCLSDGRQSVVKIEDSARPTFQRSSSTSPAFPPLPPPPVRRRPQGEKSAQQLPSGRTRPAWESPPEPPSVPQPAAQKPAVPDRHKWVVPAVSMALLAGRQLVAFTTDVGEENEGHIILLCATCLAAVVCFTALLLKAPVMPLVATTLTAVLATAASIAYAETSPHNGAHIITACGAAVLPLGVAAGWQWEPLVCTGVSGGAIAVAWIVSQGSWESYFTPFSLTLLAHGAAATSATLMHRKAAPPPASGQLESGTAPDDRGNTYTVTETGPGWNDPLWSSVMREIRAAIGVLEAEGQRELAELLQQAKRLLEQQQARGIRPAPLNDAHDGGSDGIISTTSSPHGRDWNVRRSLQQANSTHSIETGETASEKSRPRTPTPSPGHRRSIVKHPGRGRDASMTSDCGSNYVSFGASLSKRGEGQIGFSFARQSSSGSLAIRTVAETDDGDSPTTVAEGPAPEYERHPSSRKRRSVHSRHSPSARQRPSVSAGRGSPRTEPPEVRARAELKSAREVTESTRALVKTVVSMEREVASGDEIAAGSIRQFRNFDANTLQKLILLFGQLNEELDIFRAQQFIIASVCEIVGCDRASIFLTEWKRKEIWTITSEGHEIRVPMEKSLAGWAALHNEVLNIKDAQNDVRFNTDVDKQTGYLTRNMLVYPISRGMSVTQPAEAAPIAVIQAINKERGFCADDEGLLALMGKQAGIHLANSALYNQLQVEGTKTKTLLEVTRDINDVNVDLESMMARIMHRARLVLTVQRATIFLVDEEKRELWSALTDAETADKLRGEESAGGEGVIRLPLGVGLAGHVAQNGEVLNIKDAYQCDLFNPEYDRRTGFHTRSILVIPIRVGDQAKVMGVIQLINKVNGEQFTEEDVELAVTFSSFVGISLNNIILYDELREGKIVREQNKELKRLRRTAEEAAEAKGNFLMSMSHEIRTPMGGVIGMCELLASTAMSTEQMEMLDTIRNCGEALMAIINDILDYGKIGSGKLELEMREFDVVDMLEETIDVIRAKIEAKHITLALQPDSGIRPAVIGDNYRLRQIVINLVGNACKFTPDKGSITVSVVQCPASSAQSAPLDSCQQILRFSVKDTGIGISQEAQKRLFQPFEQAEAGTTRQYGGTGLGLAICKQLVEAMAGQIGIISDLGHGTEFWFTVQFKCTPDMRVLRTRLLEGHEALAGKQLLLVCGHAGMSAIIEGFLAILGVNFRVIPTAASLQAMLDSGLSAADTPHVVLVDEAVEDYCSDAMTAVLARVRELRKGQVADELRLQFALMTGMGTKVEQGPALMESGVSMILAKPPKQKQLLQLLNRTVPGPLGSPSGKTPMDTSVRREQVGRKLLVAEDNSTNQLLIKKQLKGFGIVPTICENGQLAVDKLRSEWHDLVFMDCHMPVLDGYGASKKIRELEKEGAFGEGHPPILIVALTADALPQTRQVCLEHGMDDYATKPLRKATLAQLLDQHWFKEN